MSYRTSYIGCQISLIRKRSIRYDGILPSVGTNGANIALSGGSFSSLR